MTLEVYTLASDFVDETMAWRAEGYKQIQIRSYRVKICKAFRIARITRLVVRLISI